MLTLKGLKRSAVGFEANSIAHSYTTCISSGRAELTFDSSLCST